MKYAILFLGMLAAMTRGVVADARSITFFSDGAITEIEATRDKRYCPDSFNAGND